MLNFPLLSALYGTAQFKLYTHACACTFNACKALKNWRVHALLHARDFGVRTRDSHHTRRTRDARHELALGLPHYACGVTTGTVAVNNEIQLLCSLLQLASLYVVRSIA